MAAIVIFIIKHQNTMPAITRNISIFILLLLLQGNLWAQDSYWSIPPAPKRCTVIIPSNVLLNFPTSDTYQIGFFVFTNNALVNVGSTTYSSQDIRIELGYDPLGVSGYKENQRLITLIRNTSNQKLVYGVEFIYQNDQNKYILDGSVTVLGIRYATWWQAIDPVLCQSIGEYEIKIPYGLKPALNFGSAIRNHQNEDGKYFIDLDEMAGGWNYELSITSPYIKYLQNVYTFNLRFFPIEELNTDYELCPGSSLTLPATIAIPGYPQQLTRTPIYNSSLTLKAAGEYYYSYSFPYSPTQICTTIDTLKVTYKENCTNTDYPELINPLTGQEVLFTKTEKIRVYDAAMNKVSELSSPCVWKGTDQEGNMLAPGLYFIIHEDGTTHDITLMY